MMRTRTRTPTRPLRLLGVPETHSPAMAVARAWTSVPRQATRGAQVRYVATSSPRGCLLSPSRLICRRCFAADLSERSVDFDASLEERFEPFCRGCRRRGGEKLEPIRVIGRHCTTPSAYQRSNRHIHAAKVNPAGRDYCSRWRQLPRGSQFRRVSRHRLLGRGTRQVFQ